MQQEQPFYNEIQIDDLEVNKSASELCWSNLIYGEISARTDLQ